ncbi:putative tetratricopeptide-like helical domain superfamily [Helianthus anomalus]
MASDLVTKAKEAFIDDHFELAVDLYSQAILIDPTNADLFSDRAQANIKLHNFTGTPSSFFDFLSLQIRIDSRS